MIHFAAVFDKNYLPRALAMYRSIVRYMPEAKFWLLCLDRESIDMLDHLKLSGVNATLVEDMGDSELMAVRASRNPTEFAMTAKPAWIASLIHSNRIKEGEMLILIDADIMLYADPRSFLSSIAGRSISITPHMFAPKDAHLCEKYGIYNSGLIFFTKDPNSLSCTADWRKQCIQWCYIKPQPGLYTDQRYLNSWPTTYKGVNELDHKGVNTGTWNILTFKVRCDSAGLFTVDGQPLICYHFHGLKLYATKKGSLRAYPITVYHSGIYRQHLAALHAAYAEINAITPGFKGGLAPKPGLIRSIKQYAQRLISRGIV
ncbi:MAG TPA: hypothetical protein VIR98_00820 [Candidatus Paceibacterota bacterium]|jgi:hypothetical protein